VPEIPQQRRRVLLRPAVPEEAEALYRFSDENANCFNKVRSQQEIADAMTPYTTVVEAFSPNNMTKGQIVGQAHMFELEVGHQAEAFLPIRETGLQTVALNGFKFQCLQIAAQIAGHAVELGLDGPQEIFAVIAHDNEASLHNHDALKFIEASQYQRDFIERHRNGPVEGKKILIPSPGYATLIEACQILLGAIKQGVTAKDGRVCDVDVRILYMTCEQTQKVLRNLLRDAKHQQLVTDNEAPQTATTRSSL
jgi:hypothetical protein